MTRKRKKIVFALIGVALMGYLLLWYWGSHDRFQADRIICAIEKYRHQYGKIPDPADDALMRSLGFEGDLGWYPDYEILSPIHYKIRLIVGFDCPYATFDSERGTWEDEC